MLDRKSFKLLKKLKKSILNIEEIKAFLKESEYQKYTNRLNELKFTTSVTEYINGELIGYTISLDGHAYLEERCRRFWGFVLPYAITTLIAIASVVISIIALCGKPPQA